MPDTYFPRTTDVQPRSDALGESGNQRNEASTKCRKSSPVDAVGVMVDSMVFVQLMNVESAVLDEIEIRHHYPSHRPHHTRVTGKERQQPCGIFDDIPWSTDDAEDGNQKSCSEYVDVFGAKPSDVVAEGIRASSDLIADRGKHKGESHEELGGSAVEVVDHGWHVPLEVAPNNLMCRGHEDWRQCPEST